ncbi:MAG: TetR/AcrR family transcriptional regulator [Capnocytophaga sp.]|nr:TetR/AcrR family transcriptional regulator [Capnocytophaga sp.]
MKEQIIKQAMEDFMLYGFKTFTMDDLASKVGISKRTLYEYYPSKTDLVEACLTHFLENIQENCPFEGDGNVIENWFAFKEKFLERYKITSNRPLWELKKYYRTIYDKMESQFRAFDNQRVEELVKGGQEQGFFREDIDVKFVKSFFFGMNKMRENPEVFPETEYSFRETLGGLIESFVRILVNEKGLRELERILAEKKNS